MDRKIIPIYEDEIPHIYDFKPDEIKNIEQYLYLCGQILNAESFYNIFIYNVQLLKRKATVSFTDKAVKPWRRILSEEEINALTINIISAGKSFVELVERSTKKISGDEYFKKNVISKIYDRDFSYRFLYYMRNYSQHGHLPVIKDGNTFCFDAKIILCEQEFNGNKQILNELERIQNEIQQIDINGSITYLLTILVYIQDVIEVYIAFLKWVKVYAIKYIKNVKYITKDINQRMIIYKDDSDKLHGFNQGSGIIKKISNFDKKAKKDYKYINKRIGQGKKYFYANHYKRR